MKSQIIFSLALSNILYCSYAYAKCSHHMWVHVFNNGISTMYSAGTWPHLDDAYIAPGDSLQFHVGSDDNCQSNDLLFIYNGDTLFNGAAGTPDPNYSYTAFDTGHYYMRYFFNGTYYNFDFQVHYGSLTGIKTETEVKHPDILPSATYGIFKITGCSVNQIRVVDLTGNTILEENRKVSEINLTYVPSGLYFYALTDDKYKVWFGRIVKQ